MPVSAPSEMPHFDFHTSIGHLVAPSKQVEDGDQRLERAQALFDEHQAVMDPHDYDLAHSLLEHSRDLRAGFEDKCLPTRIKQARLYSTQVDKTLQKIQEIVGVDA